MTTLSQTVPQTQTYTQPVLGPTRRPDWPVNVSKSERILAGLGGGALTFLALRNTTPGNLLLGLFGGMLLYRSFSGYCPMYSALGIDTAHGGDAFPNDFFERGIHIESSVTIDKPAGDLFRFWRNFENLPKIMRHLESVASIGQRTSHWTAKAPAATNVEWNAQIINEEENRLIAWRSIEGADVDNAGSVRFLPVPGGRETEVRIVLDYIPPAGKLGYVLAKIFGTEPQRQIDEDLYRFKQFMESGEESVAPEPTAALDI